MASTHEERLQRARVSLEGLSVGDALGGFFEFNQAAVLDRAVKTRKLPDVQWHFTDDTNMALSIYENLRLYEQIEQQELAVSFATHYDRSRGYGPSIHRFVPRVLSGQPWREAASGAFDGAGSFGNGGAMRVSPVGAYFADDMDAVVKNAHASTEVTHSHPEGVAGAIAGAVAAALAWQLRSDTVDRNQFISRVLEHVPASDIYDRLQTASFLRDETTVQEAKAVLGNGSRVTAQDTVPFVLWCAGEKLTNYEEAIWLTASAGGDVDTTCAMVGGIVSMVTGLEGIPADWIAHREPLPAWALGD
ncbi:MAG: ADP-ribosylglycohydrolase family protein [Anaerolineae bacterium]|nr:ADP-ribosylglycohydrolase family protein [Anaerolineae bacterium]